MAAAAPVIMAAALNPGTGASILDYEDANDLKFYQKAVRGLEESDKYDLSPGKLKGFLDCVRQKVKMFGWSTVVTVPTTVAPIVNRSVLESYGTVTMAECTAHAQVYMAALGRTAQNAVMMYHFLFASLTTEARNKVGVDPTQYTIGSDEEGLCYLRMIIAKAQLDTIGTIETLRSSIGKLNVKVVELSANIIDFHLHVSTITNMLDSYGQQYPELVLNLFKAYTLIEDDEFKTYIMVTRFGYNANPENYNARTLMDGVENIYKLRVEAGTWKPAISNQIDEIAKLQAQITALSTTVKEGNDNNNNNNSNSTSSSKRRSKVLRDAWKSVKPNANESTTKVYEGRTYHWCQNHNSWTMHTPAECKGINYRPGNNNNVPPSPQANAVNTAPTPVHANPVLRVNEAMSAMVRYGDDNMT